jgi:signal transduction histidine kinase/CheY-like chemotaxis protein
MDTLGKSVRDRQAIHIPLARQRNERSARIISDSLSLLLNRLGSSLRVIANLASAAWATQHRSRRTLANADQGQNDVSISDLISRARSRTTPLKLILLPPARFEPPSLERAFVEQNAISDTEGPTKLAARKQLGVTPLLERPAFRLLPSILGMFVPPHRFLSRGFEGAFLVEYTRRFTPHRRAVLLLGFIVWVVYVGWDICHGTQNEHYHGALFEILILRAAGALILLLGLSILHLKRPPQEILSEVVLSLVIIAVYFLITFTMTAIEFPINYLYYYPCLLMAIMFLCGLLRLRAKVVLGILFFFVACSMITFAFVDTKAHQQVFGGGTQYFRWYEVFYLASFALLGYAISVELERTARRSFLRERQLVRSKASIAAKNAELNRLNSDLEDSQAEMQTKTAALVAIKEEMRLRAERDNLNKSKFLAAAAHDLRQPVQALSHYLEAADYANQDGSPDRCREFINQAQVALGLTRSSFRAILDLSELEIGAVRPRYSSFDLQDLLDETVAAFQDMARRRQVRLHVRRRSGPPVVVRSDRHLLARVLDNLVSNAIKYSDPRKGPAAAVLVGMVGLPNRTRIDIVDNGVGIAKTQWASVFDPFVQIGNPTRDREKGFGLGLSIVNAIVPLLEGHRITMASTEGRGTRFSVELPRSMEAAVGPDFSAELQGVNLLELAGTYVLYVEDDTLVARATAAMFNGCGVLHEIVASVEELGHRVKMLDRMPDVVITDYRLPDDCNAEDAIRVVRDEFGNGMPVIVLTGEVAQLEDEAWYTPEICILRKPISPKVLLEKIRELSSSGIGGGSSVLAPSLTPHRPHSAARAQ